MTPERWRQIDELLDRALECEPHERRALLEQACAGDAALRGEVEALLAAHEQAPDFIEKPPLTDMQSVLSQEPHRVPSAPTQPEILGHLLGHYQINALLGAGGMGEVYRALDTRLDREVAVKVLAHKLALNPEALKRFEREAKAVAALSHPNILAIHDFGVEGETSYAVTELLQGETLRERLAHAALPWRDAVAIAIQIAEGLSAAHAQGIIHRDLKPENIFLTTAGVVKILDFGIARIKPAPSTVAPTAPSSNVTAPGRIIGTLGYMSPEQVRGEDVDRPSDVFAFGCVLYEMLRGQHPFTRPTTAETMAAILRDEPVLTTGKMAVLPDGLARLLRRSLAKQPAERYQSAHDLVLDLKALLAETRPVRVVPRRLLWLAAGLLLSLVVWLAVNWWTRATAINSLAVLPLASAAPDAQIDSVAEGVIEGVITHLSQLPALRVMARSTVFRYKNQPHDPQQVGQQLKVKAVLTGRITRKGETVVISTELVNVADGSLLWGAQYDRPLTDLTPLQTEIAERIAEQLQLSLNQAERASLRKQNTRNSAAYQLYLYGQYYLNKWYLNKGMDDSILIRKSIEYFQQAIAKDPTYAVAYAGLAEAYFLGSGSPDLPWGQALTRGRAAARKAVELDANSAEAHTSLAMIQLFYDYDWTQSERGFQRALECNGGYARAHHWYGILHYVQGRFSAAQQELRMAQELDPLSQRISNDLGLCHYFAREYEQAVAQFQRTLELDGNWQEPRRWLANTYSQQRRDQVALAEYLKVREMAGEKAENVAALRAASEKDGPRGYWRQWLAILNDPARRDTTSPFIMALPYAYLGDKEATLAWLEKALAGRLNGTHDVSGLVYLKVDPRFDLLRGDVRFQRLLQTCGLSAQ